MHSSRKQRSKAEGTFLEMVKQQLSVVLADLVDIKASLKELQDSRILSRTNPPFNLWDFPEVQPWEQWCPTEPWVDNSGSKCDEHNACATLYTIDGINVSGAKVGCGTVSVAVSQTPCVITRSELLAYRTSVHALLAPPLGTGAVEESLCSASFLAAEGVGGGLRPPRETFPCALPEQRLGMNEQEALVNYESAWCFLSLQDYANASVTCKTAWRSIAEWTAIGDQYAANGEDGAGPFSGMDNPNDLDCYDGGRAGLNVQPFFPEGAAVDGIIVAKWKGDSLCMDNVVDHFSRFGECEPLDWSCIDGQNTVPLHFQDDRSVATIRSSLTYAVKDDKGRDITVSVE